MNFIADAEIKPNLTSFIRTKQTAATFVSIDAFLEVANVSDEQIFRGG